MVEEIAIIFKRKRISENGKEEFIPLRVVEGYYSENEDFFVDKSGNIYLHIAQGVTEGNGFGMRRKYESLLKEYPNQSLKEIKEHILEKSKMYFYTRNLDESNYIYTIEKTTGKRKKFEDFDTKDLYKLYEQYSLNESENEEETKKENEKKSSEKIQDSKFDTQSSVTTPIELVNEVRKTIKGQDEAIVSIVTNIWMNVNCKNLKKKNMLVIGPSGVGKTAILTKLGKILNIPVTIFSVPGLSQAGYVGRSTDEILIQLILECNKDISKAEKGIIVLDEIDKIATNDASRNEVSTTGVQNELLKMIEGDKRMIQLDHFGGSTFMIDTRNIIFIGVGAFTELFEEKKESSPIGFNRSTDKTSKNDPKLSYDKLISYGVKRELLGRLPVVVELNSLSEDILKDIILNSDESELTKIVETLSSYGITITNIDNIVSLIAQNAFKKGIGARGLTATINTMFNKIFYEVANNPGKYNELILGENIINDNSDFQLIQKPIKRRTKNIAGR